MLTRMTEEDWATVLEVVRACRSRRGAKGRNDRIFLEAVHYFCVHNITWRALPAACGNWNSVWKRFWRLSQAGVFEAFFSSQPISCWANRSNMLAWTVRSWRIVGSGADGSLWSQQPKVYLTSSEPACRKRQIPQRLQKLSVCGWKLV